MSINCVNCSDYTVCDGQHEFECKDQGYLYFCKTSLKPPSVEGNHTTLAYAPITFGNLKAMCFRHTDIISESEKMYQEIQELEMKLKDCHTKLDKLNTEGLQIENQIRNLLEGQ